MITSFAGDIFGQLVARSYVDGLMQFFYFPFSACPAELPIPPVPTQEETQPEVPATEETATQVVEETSTALETATVIETVTEEATATATATEETATQETATQQTQETATQQTQETATAATGTEGPTGGITAPPVIPCPTISFGNTLSLYNGFFLGNFTSESVDILGRLAVGGNADLTGWY